MKSSEWKKYVDVNGGFEFPRYLYNTIMDLMKTSLDLGTMVCTDPAKLRAYKEQVKTTYRAKWLEMAAALESYEIIEPCVCGERDFCKICGGSRYLLNRTLSARRLQEVAYAVGPQHQDEIMLKLQLGLQQALEEIEGGFRGKVKEEQE